MYERHGARLLIDALQEAGQDAFAARLRDERKKALEQSKLKQARQAAPDAARKPAKPAPAPPQKPAKLAVRDMDVAG